MFQEEKICPKSKVSHQNHFFDFLSNKLFERLICPKERLEAELMCSSYKRDVSPTARNQFDPHSISWKLVKDKDPIHWSNLEKKRKAENGIKKLY
jgi:hypothetical protein